MQNKFVRVKLAIFLLLIFILFIIPIAYANHQYNYIYGNYNPYKYSQSMNSRYLINRDFGNITLPVCYDPVVKTTIPMSNTYGYGYCVENYYYRNENKDDPYVQLIGAIIKQTRYGYYYKYY